MLHDVEIDWGWPALAADARVIVRLYEARLRADRKRHTIESVERLLELAARDLPDVPIRARAVDDHHVYGWQVVEGDVYPGEDFDETGMFPGELTADDFHAVGIDQVLTPIVVPDSMRDELFARGSAPLATAVQQAWQVAADALPAGFRTPGGPRRVQTMYLPVDVWAAIQLRARMEHRTMSYIVQRTLTAAYELAVD